jgi:prophage antirepressor-like protein
MDNVTRLVFKSQEVRWVIIDKEPWFALSDILRAINSTTKLGDAQKSVIDTFDGGVVDHPIKDTMGREQMTTVIPEYGVTFLLSRSNTEEGKQMNRWIHKEILPRIRKTRQYKVNTYTVTPQPNLLAIERSKHYQKQFEVLESSTLPKHIKALLTNHLKRELDNCLVRQYKVNTYTVTPQPNLLAIERSKHYQKQFEVLESSTLPKHIKALLTNHLKRELDNCLVFTDSQNYDTYRWEEILIHFAQHIEILLENGSVGDWNCRKVRKTDDTGVVRHYLAVIVYQADGGVWPGFKELCGDVPYYNGSIKDLAEMLGSSYDYEQFQVRRGSLEWEKKRCVMLHIYTDFSQCILPELKEQTTLKPSILR